jgi:mannose-1-phosphate guanylyltransferase
MNVMMLAAGEGTRLRPFTTILPKPAIPFLNVPLAAHSLNFLSDIQINKLVVNTFHLPEKIHELFHSLPKISDSLIFSDEKGTILNSGGGLGNARKHFISGGDFIMMNADEVILPKDSQILKKAIEHHKQTKALVTLLVMKHPGAGNEFGGVWSDDSNNIKGFGKEKIPNTSKVWHFIGVEIFSERIFDYIPESTPSNILYDCVAKAIGKNEVVQAYPIHCTWFETGNPTDLFNATKSCLNFLKDDFGAESLMLIKAFEKFAGEKFQLRSVDQGQVFCARDLKLDPSIKIKGLACIGKGATIQPNTVLENVIVNKNLTVSGQHQNTLVLS